MSWGAKWEPGKAEAITETVKQKLQDLIGESIKLTVPIKSGWSSVTIDVIRVGDLAVYFGDEEEIGLVTHIPTLTKFDNAIPDGDWTQEQLVLWCWKVQEGLHTAWEILKQYDNLTYKTLSSDFLKQLQTHCLSVAVE